MRLGPSTSTSSTRADPLGVPRRRRALDDLDQRARSARASRSSETWSAIAAASVPPRGENTKVKAPSKPTSSTTATVSRKSLVGLAREADDQVGRQREVGNRGAHVVDEREVPLARVRAAHRASGSASSRTGAAGARARTRRRTRPSRAITSGRKSFGCGLVKRIRSIPSIASHCAQELGEADARVRREVAAVRVHVLAEQRDLADALGGQRRRSRRRSRPAGATRSRPRTAGTMQYAHFELQPIEICTHAWNGRSRWSGQHRRRSGARPPCRTRCAAPRPRRRASRRGAGSTPGRTRRRRTGTARRCARAAPRRSSRRRRSRAPGRGPSAPSPARGAQRAAGRASRGSCRC